MGRDDRFVPAYFDGTKFQPTRPHGARPTADTQSADSGVSTHAPAWGATDVGSIVNAYLASFNPRARMGRDIRAIMQDIDPREFQPTRPHGARRHWLSWMSMLRQVSTHAPAWGATLFSEMDVKLRLFQPTRPHGARPVITRCPPSFRPCFNPRARMGRDQCQRGRY